ncbi:hypothetical protein GJ699_05625 [Duganella sp. FT80W]|uniref:Uncharacterized protein n=1 Tax=Duganella guangzhouensis TaxID=2666084 RepID=A0A6I2KWS4_9BURK|nr:hypothetical protein [Duganella guangzhouensis]MRW89457.1 hypothetical protein [Duganella guangzhouensis]
MPQDSAVDILLAFDGSILEQGDGYWIKMEAKLVDISKAVPHGIRYSLTLHDPSGGRILGFADVYRRLGGV